MFNEKSLESYLNNFNYDIRELRNARWIDQKCTPDVVCIIADCVVNYIGSNEGICFSTKDIWNSEYAQEISFLFSKPDIHSKNARNEYDKFFQQPLELLAYSGVLSKTKKGNTNIYSVKNQPLLQYIAIREKNALNFLINYIEKVLKDSDLFQYFEAFFKDPSVDGFRVLKKMFADFTILHTSINKELESNRIFTKILNPLAFFYNSYGTDRGRMSRQKISYDQLMYNRINFRDLYKEKPKDITRNEYEPSYDEKISIEKFWKYNSRKAKKLLRQFNDEFFQSKSEHIDDLDNSDAIHMHHIFPEADHPSISGHIENLIALTPSQHLNKAHPHGKTQEINKDYQYALLISKTSNIEKNLKQSIIPKIYDYDRYKEVLAVGLNDIQVYDIEEMDFSAIGQFINSYYN